jgi:hypothetical protein
MLGYNAIVLTQPTIKLNNLTKNNIKYKRETVKYALLGYDVIVH